MNEVDYAQPARSLRRRRRFLIPLGTIISIALIAIVVLVVSMKAGSMRPQKASPTGTSASTAPPSLERFDSAAVFAKRVEPALRRLQEKNDEAVERAIAKIHGHFERARTGAPEFAESIIGPLDAVKTTYLAGKGVFLRWWHEDQTIQPVADHVRWNYEQHVTSGLKIKEAILGAITQLEEDFRANRNEALQAIGSSLRAANLPASVEIDQKKLDEFCQHEFEAALSNVNTDHPAEKAAIGSAAAISLSTAAMFIVERAILYVLGDSIAVAGGSVAGGTASGAVAGSWVPGPGTAIGAAAGLLAGIAVDMWVSHKNKEQTTAQVTKSLTQIEDAIIQGEEKRPGIRKILGDAAGRQAEQLGLKLKQQLAEAAR